ncbi:hypothetical protein FKP32DRAFT_1553104, partial [Trametes sanguinea]
KGSRLRILEQRPRVKRTLNAAIFMCQADLLTRNAFPDSAEKYNALARTALVRSADDMGFKNLVKRLKVDDDYAFALAAVPVDRIPLFRSRARDAVNSALRTTYGLKAGDVAHVNWLLKGCRYIYPHDYAPYALPIFAEGIRAAYFKTPKSFGWKIVPKFSSSLPEKPDEKEIPAALLALVFAAIDDHRTSPYEASEFTTNFFANAYSRNIRILSELKDRALEGYHDLMHNLF